jgi:hypothetical protein
LFRVILLALFGIILVTYIGLAFARLKTSNENRFRYYLIVNFFAFCAICVYEVVGTNGFFTYSNGIYAVMPTVGIFLYTSLAFHGQREAERKNVFNALDEPSDVDYSIGIDELVGN